jgi:HEAT repeat protein
MRRFSMVLACGILLLAGFSATAQKPAGKKASQKASAPKSAAPAIGAKDVKDAIHKLKSPNPEEVLSSVQLLAASGSRDAVAPLTDLLRNGPRNDITNSILQALGSLGQKGSIPILMEYLDHRRPDARIAALFALENFDDVQVIKAMEDRLRDSDAEVRNTAALLIGRHGGASSVPILFQSFDRGVRDAVIAIGQIGSADDAARLAKYLGKVDVKALLPGFEQFLARNDMPEKAKLSILDQLFELAGPDVRRFAVSYKATFPPGTEEDTNPLYKAVCRMIRQIAEE